MTVLSVFELKLKHDLGSVADPEPDRLRNDPYRTNRSGSVLKLKAGSGSISKGTGSATLDLHQLVEMIQSVKKLRSDVVWTRTHQMYNVSVSLIL